VSHPYDASHSGEETSRLESLSLVRDLDPHTVEDGGWRRPPNPITEDFRGYPGRLHGNVGLSHGKIRSYLVAALLTVALGLLGTEYALRPNGSLLPSRTNPYGVAFEGTIRPAIEFRVNSTLSGTVAEIYVKVGDTVQPGQALVRLDSSEARLNLEQAEMALQAAQINLEAFRVQLADADAQLSIAQREEQQVPTRQWRDSPERAQAAYDQALTNYNRAQQLFDAGVIAQQEVDARHTDLRIAEDDLNNAKRLAAASSTLENEQRSQAGLQVTVARHELQQQLSEAQLKYDRAKQTAQAAVVRATQSGVLSEIPARVGDQVTEGTLLARLARLDEMIVEVPVAAKMVSDLKAGQPALVDLPSVPPKEVNGEIHTINPLPSSNMTHTVEVEFQNLGLLLLAGQPAEVRFLKP
jgi:multidrug resistance efflux pump